MTTVSDALSPSIAALESHLATSQAALTRLDRHLTHLAEWGRTLHERLRGGGRLLVAGNGGSAALAQHLTAELVGRYRDERPPFSAIPLSADTSAVTAIANDYGYDTVFARQVAAHGRPGDIVLLLSTSGRSANLVEAARTAAARGMTTWAITGRGPNPLASATDDALPIDADGTPTVQEVQQVAVHLLCVAFDTEVARAS